MFSGKVYDFLADFILTAIRSLSFLFKCLTDLLIASTVATAFGMSLVMLLMLIVITIDPSVPNYQSMSLVGKVFFGTTLLSFVGIWFRSEKWSVDT